MHLKDNYRYVNITTATSTQITSNAGQLIKVIVNKTQATPTVIIDGTGSTPIATLKGSIAEGSYEFLCTFTQGLKVTTGNGGDLTIVYSSIGN